MDPWDRCGLLGCRGPGFQAARASGSSNPAQIPKLSESTANPIGWVGRAAPLEPSHQLVSSCHNWDPFCRAAERRNLSGQYAKPRRSSHTASISICEGRGSAHCRPAENERCDRGIHSDEPAAKPGADRGKDLCPDRSVAIADRNIKSTNCKDTCRSAAQPDFAKRFPSGPVGAAEGST